MDPVRARTFFARATVLSNLLQSRLAVPLLYPLNTGAMTARGADAPKEEKNNPIASQKWQRDELAKGLSLMTPAIVGMTKIVHILKAANALSHHRGGVARRVYVQRKRTARDGRESLHLLRPQVWRLLKPGDENRTRHLKWRR
uniref:Uncharacterized protein n=1 Tax=Chromera velia CCMP2878 TaxID=1169474 RepID=A0A0G4HYT2_9ALVE|mmetsp:Transcript_16245/g.32923  ORF Transcript_16245/g.32923 Transcript_16245/m.32923 type:complete len:143 (+) Transcript_16245:242-670(+)|eukprot:Cvel_9572.t1-p1 / transcript=Cvel_9572.t1 / gene=Cvel_9572 / organism=Chromera_velia_CCMP2878 / gene_product=hypothetical protein / transcript_product=hypothetical protein / location=Cvel_scaffold555:10376-12083(-) / protein_length=142 / sequence_SO=supercontig / SO=protein_coding / is_pseudo=false